MGVCEAMILLCGSGIKALYSEGHTAEVTWELAAGRVWGHSSP